MNKKNKNLFSSSQTSSPRPRTRGSYRDRGKSTGRVVHQDSYNVVRNINGFDGRSQRRQRSTAHNSVRRASARQIPSPYTNGMGKRGQAAWTIYDLPWKAILLGIVALLLVFGIANGVKGCTSQEPAPEEQDAKTPITDVSQLSDEQKAILNSESNDSSVASTISGQGVLTGTGYGRVHMLAVGDNIMNQQLLDYADGKAGSTGDGSYDFNSLYDNVRGTVQAADVSFVNQETVLGGNATEFAGYPDFNSPNEVADALQNTGFDVVAMNSNHSLDASTQGVKNQNALMKNYTDLVEVGSYDSDADAQTIRIVQRNGIKIAFLSYNYGINGRDSSSLTNSTLVNIFTPEKLQRDIPNAKKVADVVVVSMHWGKEYTADISDEQKKYAQLCADNGADVVLGTHPHTIQPVEWVSGKDGNKTLVAYSLGDFETGYTRVECILGGMLTWDFVRGEDGKVTIENIVWKSLIEDQNADGTYSVQFLKDYTSDQASANQLFSSDNENNSEEQLADPVGWMRNHVQQVISSEFNPEY